jgi:hypothetical protein
MRNVLILLAICLACIGWKSNGGWDSGPIYSRAMYERGITSDTLTANESGKVVSFDCSGGSTACTIILPTAAPGLSYSFISEAAEVFYIDTGVTTDTIRYLTMSAGDKLQSPGTTADSIELISTQAGYWNVRAMKGVWVDGN